MAMYCNGEAFSFKVGTEFVNTLHEFRASKGWWRNEAYVYEAHDFRS